MVAEHEGQRTTDAGHLQEKKKSRDGYEQGEPKFEGSQQVITMGVGRVRLARKHVKKVFRIMVAQGHEARMLVRCRRRTMTVPVGSSPPLTIFVINSLHPSVVFFLARQKDRQWIPVRIIGRGSSKRVAKR